MGTKRSTKWYRKNEIDVMKALGMEGTKNSGSGWIEKEDGQNEYLICQLKSTDAGSIGIKKKDIDILNYNASVVHKIPVFAIQYIQSGEVYILMKPSDITEVAKYIETGECSPHEGIDLSDRKETTTKKIKIVKNSENSRNAFYEERTRNFEKREKERKCKKT
jgi:hypothetical protein